ncbi:MAG: gamma-glutamyltransferase [Candidatus Eisenbacteria bacterium]
MRPATDAAPTESPIEPSTAASSAMVATACPAATEAALEMLRVGGNAADAAAAAAWALAVCEPSGSGLGGQAIALVHLPDGTDLVVDGHSHGPESLTRRLVDRGQQRRGPRATTVPSMPATIGSIQARFGRLPLATTLAPAHRLADEGVVSLLRQTHPVVPVKGARVVSGDRLHLPSRRASSRKGTLLRQARLASTLSRLATAGVEDFITAAWPETSSPTREAQGGLLRSSDLSTPQAPAYREPIEIEHRGYRVERSAAGGGLQLLPGLTWRPPWGSMALRWTTPGMRVWRRSYGRSSGSVRIGRCNRT